MKLTERQRVFAADGGLLLAAFFWGVSFAAMKGALDAFPTFWLLAIRFLTAFFLLYVFIGRSMVGQPPELFRRGLIAGVLMFAGFGLQTLGLTMTTASKQAFITSTYVMFVPLITWVMTRKFPGRLPMFTAVLCCSGMWLLTSDDAGGTFNMGDALTVLCAVVFAAHLMYIGRSLRRVRPVMLATLQIGVTGVLSLLTALCFETWPGFNGMNGLPELGFAILFPTIGSYLLQNISQKYANAIHAALLMSLEGVFGVLAGVFLLGELFTMQMALGCAVIFSAAVIAELAPMLPAFSNKNKEGAANN